MFELRDNAIDLLIQYNQQFREEFMEVNDNFKRFSDLAVYAMNFCIRVDTGRMTGKTYYIAQKLDEGNAIVICSEQQKENPLLRDKPAVFSLQDVAENRHDNTPYNTVYIDDARWLLPTKDQEMDLIRTVVKDHKTVFLLLG